MQVYVFGNINLDFDNSAIKIAKYFGDSIPNVKFEFVNLNSDLPFDNNQDAVIMDVVEGLDSPTLISSKQLDSVVLPPRTTAHDFDLGLQLKYLKKLGKLGDIRLIGLPMQGDVNYNLIHSILRKLVAQDMQGS